MSCKEIEVMLWFIANIMFAGSLLPFALGAGTFIFRNDSNELRLEYNVYKYLFLFMFLSGFSTMAYISHSILMAK